MGLSGVRFCQDYCDRYHEDIWFTMFIADLGVAAASEQIEKVSRHAMEHKRYMIGNGFWGVGWRSGCGLLVLYLGLSWFSYVPRLADIDK